MSAPERRTHERQAAAVPVALDVELHGFDHTDARFQARGKTVNVSPGGLLAQVDRPIDAGTRCVVHFPLAIGVLGRTMVYGSVRRCAANGSLFEVALYFDTPMGEAELELLDEEN